MARQCLPACASADEILAAATARSRAQRTERHVEETILNVLFSILEEINCC